MFRPQRSPCQVQNCFVLDKGSPSWSKHCTITIYTVLREILDITPDNMRKSPAGAQPATRMKGIGLGFHRGSLSFQALKMMKKCVCSVE